LLSPNWLVFWDRNAIIIRSSFYKKGQNYVLSPFCKNCAVFLRAFALLGAEPWNEFPLLKKRMGKVRWKKQREREREREREINSLVTDIVNFYPLIFIVSWIFLSIITFPLRNLTFIIVLSYRHCIVAKSVTVVGRCASHEARQILRMCCMPTAVFQPIVWWHFMAFLIRFQRAMPIIFVYLQQKDANVWPLLPAWNNSSTAEWIFYKIWFWKALLIFMGTLQFYLKLDNNIGHFTWRRRRVSTCL
jgi:hypothetical protein